MTGANTITSRAEACDPEVQVGMPYLAIPDSINGTIYTDYEGNAFGVTAGSRTLAVDGRYFDVNYFRVRLTPKRSISLKVSRSTSP